MQWWDIVTSHQILNFGRGPETDLLETRVGAWTGVVTRAEIGGTTETDLDFDDKVKALAETDRESNNGSDVDGEVVKIGLSSGSGEGIPARSKFENHSETAPSSDFISLVDAVNVNVSLFKELNEILSCSNFSARGK